MDLYDRATYRFEGGLGALYYELTDFVRVVQYEHDEYFQSKKMGRHAPLRASSSNKKAQLSLTNPRDACEKFAQFT